MLYADTTHPRKDGCAARERIQSSNADALRCITAVSDVKVAKFEFTDSNVRKRLKASPHVTWLFSYILVEPTQPCGLTVFASWCHP